MEPRILIPVDDSETTHKTLEAILSVKERFPRKLTLLHVIDDKLAYRMIPDFQVEMVRERAHQAGKAFLEKIAKRFRETGFEVELLLEIGAPRQIIPQVANDRGFQLLVIGRRPDGGEIRDVLFGSVSNFVLHHVKCPVLLF